MTFQLPEALRGLVNQITPVGSRVTCDPAPTDTDADYLVYVDPVNTIRFLEHMAPEGFEAGGSRVEENSQDLVNGESGFVSFTLGEVNLIVTSNWAFHRAFLAATSVSKRLNIMDKADRITLFQAVLYGNECCPLPPLLPPAPVGDEDWDEFL